MSEKFAYISIICPVYNEEKYIDACISSMLVQDYPKDKIEILFIDGKSTDNTNKIIQSYSSKYSFIKLLNNEFRAAPYALNLGIQESTGDIIMRIDGHSEYPSHYVSTLVKNLRTLSADNVGGVINTLPAKDTVVCRSIAVASSHPFGVGNSYFRIGIDKILEVDTVPFGCFRRELFDKIGLFDEDLIRNQDDEFNARIIKGGGKIYIVPSIVINYVARDSISKMARMYYQYGLFKPLVNKKLGSPATLRQFFPALFVLGILIGAALSLFSTILSFIYLGVLCLYGLISLTSSIIVAARYKDYRQIIVLPMVFFIIHINYGCGYLHGLYRIFTGKKIDINIKK